MSRTDAELVTAARGGDRAAVDELLARYEPTIYRFGLRMCGDNETAREVLQETMLAAFRNLSGFRGQAALSTWLYQIARSFCIKQRERVTPRAVHDDVADLTDLADQNAPPDVQLDAHRVGKMLADAIAGLPPEQREVIVLRDVEGLSAAEAAEIVGVDVGALKSRLHRARMALRKRMAGAVEASSEPCTKLLQELSAYAEADIDRDACARIEAHLAACPSCTSACEALKQTISLCASLPGQTVPEPVRAAVRRAIAGVTG